MSNKKAGADEFFAAAVARAGVQELTSEKAKIAAPVNINGKRGNVAVVVQQKGKNKYHVHRILMPDGSKFVYENIQQNAEPTGDSIAKENSRKRLSISSASNNSIPQKSELSTDSAKKCCEAICYVEEESSGG